MHYGRLLDDFLHQIRSRPCNPLKKKIWFMALQIAILYQDTHVQDFMKMKAEAITAGVLFHLSGFIPHTEKLYYGS